MWNEIDSFATKKLDKMLLDCVLKDFFEQNLGTFVIKYFSVKDLVTF